MPRFLSAGAHSRANVRVVLLSALSVMTCGVWSAFAQGEGRRFAVAAIHRSNATTPGYAIRPTPGGRLTATNVTLRQLIRYAYQRVEFELEGGADWLGRERYDVAATAEGNATVEQLREMTRALLADRFALTVREETRDAPRYVLRPARRDRAADARLRRSAIDCAAPRVTPQPSPVCNYFGFSPDIPLSSGRSQLAIRGMTMTTFARQLAPALGRPVIDSTGLSGYYDADFDFTAELGPPPPPPGVAPVFESTNAPSIFAVLPQQLGLRLESDNGPVAFLIVDGAARPTVD